MTPAVATPPPVEVRAEDVVLDARNGDLTVKGNVAIDVPPFYLRSDQLDVKRSPRGIVVGGKGRVAFCPCLETPLAVHFDGALVGPPADLVLHSPTLEVFGLPIAWLPSIWLRAPTRPGLLPPEIAYRGEDGLYLGLGGHLPLSATDSSRGLDLWAGAYLVGGVATDATLRTATTTTRVRVDHLSETGLLVDARGSLDAGPFVAWDVDALRGSRAVFATTPLETAARPFDRARASATFFAAPFTVALGFRATDARGGSVENLGAYGPSATVRAAGAITDSLVGDATVDGAVLASPAAGSLGIARAEGGLAHAFHAGPVGVATTARAAGSVAAEGADSAADGAYVARVTASIPLARAFGSGPDPWIHRVEPRVSGGVVGLHGDELLAYVPGRGAGVVRGNAGVVEVGLASLGGRLGRRIGTELTGALGLVAGDSGARPMSRWRIAGDLDVAGIALEYARITPSLGQFSSNEGDAVVGRARLGLRSGPNLGIAVAGRGAEGDAVAARLLFDAPLEPSSGFLAASGWTGSLRASLPLGKAVALSGGVDGDLTASRLLGARGGVVLRDGCGCLTLRLSGAHRLGRPGVDVWLNVEIASLGY